MEILKYTGFKSLLDLMSNMEEEEFELWRLLYQTHSLPHQRAEGVNTRLLKAFLAANSSGTVEDDQFKDFYDRSSLEAYITL